MPLKFKKDGRIILTGKEYTAFRRQVYADQNMRCRKCGGVTSVTADPISDYSFHVHHIGGRGLGGGKRNDVLEAVEGLCGACHRRQHGQI